MKNVTLYTLGFLLASAIWLGGCNKGAQIKGSTTTNAATIKALISAATVTTIDNGALTDFTVDKAGNVYVLKNNTIYKVTAGVENTFYTPVTQDTSHNTLNCISADSTGNIYTASTNSLSHVQQILEISPSGSASAFISNFSKYITDNDSYLFHIAFDKDGDMYFEDVAGIHKINTSGQLTLISSQSYENEFTVDQNDDVIFVSTSTPGGPYSVVKTSPAGATSTVAGPDNVNFVNIQGLTVDGWGNVFISDLNAGILYGVDTKGNVYTVLTNSNAEANGPVATAKIYPPYYLACDGQGNIYFYEVSNTGGISDLRKITR